MHQKLCRMYIIGQWERANPPLRRSAVHRTTDPAKVDQTRLPSFASSVMLAKPPPTIFFGSTNSICEKCYKNPGDAETAFNDFIATRTPEMFCNRNK